MTEYIEKEALIKGALKNKAIYDCCADIVDFKEIINSTPTADAKLVIHAHWIYHHDITGNYYSCSHCTCGRVENPEKYCHDCGAKMDEKEGENNE